MIKKLLLIDDDQLTSYLIKKLIGGIGEVKEFQIKENGLEGLEYLAELRYNQQSFPDVILLDIDMPVMNGFEFAEIYENIYWNKYPGTKLIMVTSSKRKPDFEKCLSYKCVVDCIYKPLTPEKIEQLVFDRYHQNKIQQV
jgi:CheY-like chemotaxis protein